MNSPQGTQGRKDAQRGLSQLQIEQMEGGQHDGKYVAKDAVAKLTGKDSRDTRKKVKTMVADGHSGHYQSRTIVPYKNENVRFTQLFVLPVLIVPRGVCPVVLNFC